MAKQTIYAEMFDKHIDECKTCMSRKPCKVLAELTEKAVNDRHKDLLAAAGEVKVSRWWNPGDRASMLRIEKRGSEQVFTQEEAGAIELGINQLLHGED